MIYEGKREDIILILETIARFCEGSAEKFDTLGVQSAVENLKARFIEVAQEARKEVANIDEPYRLGVVGMFKSGKSSVLNTFLRRLVLKEGRTETTSVLTELKFADSLETESGEILFANGSRLNMTVAEALDYTDIRSEIFQNLSTQERRTKQESIKRIILNLHCEFLRNVRLLDTPGFGGSSIGDRKALEALSDVDAALMIFPADRLGTQNELEIADELSRRNRQIIAMLNKIDDDYGNLRKEEALESAESFIRDHFRTIVRDSNNTPLIFRFSAKETWKAIEIIEQDSASEEQKREAAAALSKWGYAGSGEADSQKSVIDFIRESYGSNQTGQKIDNARVTLLKSLDRLLATLTNEAARAEAAKGVASAEYEKRSDTLNKKINPKIDFINAKIEDIVKESTQPFLRDVEKALIDTVERFSEVDMDALIRFFKSESVVQEEIMREFRSYLPESREKMLAKNIERQIRSLLEREWMFISSQISKIDLSLPMPNPNDILNEVKTIVDRMALAWGGQIAALAAVVLAPGGVIIVAIAGLVYLLTESLGFYYSSKLDRKRAQTTAKIQSQMKNLAESLNFNLIGQAQQMNNHMADKARQDIFAELGEVENQRTSYEDLIIEINRTSKGIDKLKTMFDEARN
jgi:ribosome biogenesis GTPase A